MAQNYIHVLKCDRCGAAILVVNEDADYEVKLAAVDASLRCCHACGVGAVEYVGQVKVTP